MKERNRDAADDWMREHMPSEGECSLEDNDERGCERRYYVLRSRDGAMVGWCPRCRRSSSMKTSSKAAHSVEDRPQCRSTGDP